MTQTRKKTGWTLTELLVVMAVMAILMGISVPAAKKLIESFEGSTGARAIIDAAMSNARAIAVREQRYAGVRFQADLSGKQYLIFIIHDQQNTNLANGFRTVEGRKPMPLPKNIGVIFCQSGCADADFNSAVKLTDTTTFSIVFSPQGSFIIHKVRVYSSDGKSTDSADRLFNSKDKVSSEFAKFRRDGDSEYNAGMEDVQDGYDKENSINSFIIYNQKELNKYPATSRWTSYLKSLAAEFVNPYTGQLVEK